MEHSYSPMKRILFQVLNRVTMVALLSAFAALIFPAWSAEQAPSGPAGSPPNSSWTPVKSIDFSSKHNVLIKNEDGTLTPMDVPYYKATLISPGTWQILSDGDYTYLVEGDNEALVIDSGYGAGNIREYCQTLTKKPVRYIANTHEHFDHTANNSYFDGAFMSAVARQKATIPYPSFAGINFPRNYPITVIGDGYKFQLGNREIEVFEIPNHTMGDLAFLDRRERILFSGDAFLPMGMTINAASSVARFAGNMRKLAAHRSEFDRMAGGPGIVDASAVDKYLANAEYILAGHEGDLAQQQGGPGGPGRWGGAPQGTQPNDSTGTVIYARQMARAPDRASAMNQANEFIRKMNYADCTITYDIRHVKD